MIWLFITLGLLGLTSALQGLGLAVLRRHGTWMHAAAVAFFVAAWMIGHENFLGWAALLIGVLATIAGHASRHRNKSLPAEKLVESGAFGGRSIGESLDPPVNDKTLDDRAPLTLQSSASNSADDQSAHDSGMAPEPADAPPSLASWTLLAASWQFVPDVFLASLRRCGQRTARLEGPSVAGKTARFTIGRVTLELEYHSSPMDAAALEEAAALSWDWPEALPSARSHAARIRITTTVSRYDREGDSSRVSALRLHGLAHQALGEFAPVSAIYWPDAGRLLSPSAAPGGSAVDSAIATASSTAVNFRTFPLDGSEAGRYVCDSMGMDALGLLDMQVTVDGEPDEEVSRALYALAARQLESGMPPDDGLVWPDDAPPRWRIVRASARFGRARPVLRLEPIEAEGASEADESAGSPPPSDFTL